MELFLSNVFAALAGARCKVLCLIVHLQLIVQVLGTASAGTLCSLVPSLWDRDRLWGRRHTYSVGDAIPDGDDGFQGGMITFHLLSLSFQSLLIDLLL